MSDSKTHENTYVRLAYLAPHLPSFSTTFVYEELIAIERRGIQVVPFSMFPAPTNIPGQEDLHRRTRVLYGSGGAFSTGLLLIASIAALPKLQGTWKAFGWLLNDLRAIGILRLNSFKLIYHWLTGARLGLELRKSKCTHLHVHFANAPAQIGMYASAFSDIPFTMVGHANDIFENGFLLREKASRATRFITISEHNVRYLILIGIPKERLAIVRCGVSFQSNARKIEFLTSPPYRVGSLARLIEKKGMDDVLHAVAILLNSSVRVKLLIAGDGPLRGSLESLAIQLGISEFVKFEGAMDHVNVSSWMASLDAFVLACKSDANGDMDGIPVVLMEAMSQRVPVVSTQLSGIPELVVHDRTGLLAQPNDPVALSRELRRLFESPNLCARLTDAAVAHVEAEFSQGVNVDRLLQLIGVGTVGKRSDQSTSQQ